ncbi:sulfatase [Reichenbachiella sp.]|uniref:sulfatase n=1 Tax=Reichenbachiella sp. TaxID=2184521 RepID=UPI003296A5CC
MQIKLNYPTKISFVFLIAAWMLCGCSPGAEEKKNVLFIIVDDLKPMLNSFGQGQIISPHIDQLTSKGVSFQSAYCQQAICTASRMSFITGMRPDYTKIWDLSTNLRDIRPNAVTIPQHFKNNGYQTAGMGKVMHGAHNDDPVSWTIPFITNDDLEYAEGYKQPANSYQSPEVHVKWDSLQSALKNDPNADKGWVAVNRIMKSAGLRPAVESLDVPDAAYSDGASALKGIELMKEFQENGEKFFLTMGFQKPHLPFAAPKKYWDLYDPKDINLAAYQEKAMGAPAFANHNSGELNNYSDIAENMNDKGKVTEEKQRELIHGYYACVSYVDVQIGLLMDHLKKSGLEENTIVVLMGDHGWHLGDHGLWNKHSNYEQATRTPLIFAGPGVDEGLKNKSTVELIDVFPTVCNLAGIEPPNDLDGENLSPILNAQAEKVKDYAISQYPRRCNVVASVIGKYPEDCTLMGYAVRNDKFRYVAWVEGNYEDRTTFDESMIVSEELYNYETDPLEKKSLASDPDFKVVKAELLAYLKSKIWSK